MCSRSVMPDSLQPHGLSPPGSPAHGIFQARILEWVTTSYSRASFWPRDQTCISCSGRRILYHWATWLYVPILFLLCMLKFFYNKRLKRKADLALELLDWWFWQIKDKEKKFGFPFQAESLGPENNFKGHFGWAMFGQRLVESLTPHTVIWNGVGLEEKWSSMRWNQISIVYVGFEKMFCFLPF